MVEGPIRVKSAPGVVWKKRRGDNFEARWHARQGSIDRGFPIKSVKLWSGAGNPTKQEWDYIAATASQLQQEMYLFDKGNLPASMTTFDGTLSGLMNIYRRDPDSTYRNLRYKTRVHYDSLMSAIEREYGGIYLSELKARTFLRWHEGWIAKGAVAGAHGKIGLLRTMFGFGATILENEDCQRLSGVLSKMRFQMPKSRDERLTAEQAAAIRAVAHQKGRPSVALAQAFQFEGMLRQKDVIGEWVPMGEPGASDVTFTDDEGRSEKWLRGIRWNEIDANLILRHVTSKRLKEIVIDLKLAPMILEELTAQFGYAGDRSVLPASGPLVVSEWSGIPGTAVEFRRWWRICADACGVPRSVKNMDSRAGAISEATDAGAELEHVRHAATHSNISMTQRYSRGAEEKVAKVMQLRVDHRTKNEK